MSRPRDSGLTVDQLPNPNPQKWELQPSESLLWHTRFLIYLKMGRQRTVTEAYSIYMANTTRKLPKISTAWYSAATRWKWKERAHAWDVAEDERREAEEQALRRTLHEQRLTMFIQLMTTSFDGLGHANLSNLTQDEARDRLPILRLLFRDMVTLQWEEFDKFGAQVRAAELSPPRYTGDDYRRAQMELEAWRATEIKQAAPGPDSRAPAEPPQVCITNRNLLICVGADAALNVDLAALRAVKSATGLDFHRIVNVKRDNFDTWLRRERSNGRPVQLLHLSVHATHEGVQFADGLVDGDWLSERLLGVQIMLLAGCESDTVGDWLGVVPYVITLAEEITHENAATLTQHFWSAIGRGLTPDEALQGALDHCPPVVSEYVVRHW